MQISREGINRKHPTQPYIPTQPRRIVWQLGSVIVFQDENLHFWRYCRDTKELSAAIVRKP
jgi:hypothetical protein